MTLIAVDELFIVGETVTPEQLNQIIEETPPCYRFEDAELKEKGIPHLLRIRKELWKRDKK